VFGPETRGLPESLLERYPDHLRIPIWGEVRSLNLSTATGIVLYQAYASLGMLDGR
jgi:tRNA (cytidine/uridine-2'-O-)-methyltransferase